MTNLLWLWWLAGTLPPLGVLWGLWRIGLRHERCFGYNRVLLLLAPAVAAAWPLLPHPASLGPSQLVVSAPGTGGPVTVVLLPAFYVRTADAALGWAGWQWLVALYAAGVALGLARLAYRYGQLHRATRRLPREARLGYTLARTGGRLPVSSFGRTVYWDETAALAPTEAAAVLAHELAHVGQGHSYDVLWLELWRIVLWPNPFAHLLLPALRLTHELLADQAATAVASAEAGATPYPVLLARLAARPLVGRAGLPLLQSFAFSSTLTRIAMLKTQLPVRRWKQWLPLPLLSSLFLAACQTTPDMQTIAPPPPPPPPILVENSELAATKVDVNKVYTYVEQMPALPGTDSHSNAAIVAAILSKLVYPKGEQAEGKVFAMFTVGADGVVRDVHIIKGLTPGCDEAVLNAVRQLPTFIPGQQRGQKVKVSFTVPVLFKVES